nr:hypothetical protein [Lachnoclostridium phocaeense]
MGYPQPEKRAHRRPAFFLPSEGKISDREEKKDMQNYCPQGAYHRKLLASGNVYNYIIENEGEVY